MLKKILLDDLHMKPPLQINLVNQCRSTSSRCRMNPHLLISESAINTNKFRKTISSLGQKNLKELSGSIQPKQDAEAKAHKNDLRKRET